MRISLIVAVAENGVIGNHGQLPWKLPDDLQRFRSLTEGHIVIMGRKTYESIGHPLPKRKNIVISRTMPETRNAEPTVYNSLTDALWSFTGKDVEIFIIGGSEMFKEAIEIKLAVEFAVDRIFWTKVHANVEGDIKFPNIDWSQWQEVKRSERHPADTRNEYDFTFIDYERIHP